ncbi:UDP-glycosyltransferase 74G1-like [Syzygium oleosum]|uniref:UDP-glycosyltransferase 74G1-like n=1 Tax=Syzygium oleosum TaxID=219896 RepID=UPI0024BB467F|nr:UDP-glycosyltransferase 74G1-like [Syzygium oleosum]
MEEEKEEVKRPSKARVLVLPYPAQGHISPMLQFAKRLVSRGVGVTLATTVFVAKSMHAAPNDSVGIETISDGFDEGGSAQAESIGAYLTSLQAVGWRTLVALIKKLDSSGDPIDAVIYDGFLSWALDVAKQFGKLGVAFYTQACAVNSIYYHAHQGLLPLPLPGTTISLPGLPPLEPAETPSFLYIPGSYPAFFDLIVNDQFSNVDEADLVLYNSFYELENEVVDHLAKLWPLKTVGPAIPSIYLDKRLQDDKDYGINLFKPNTQVCLSWLDDKPANSVIYVSFGSMAELDTSQMEELARGLKNSNKHFLWVVRDSEMAKLPPGFAEQSCSEVGLVVPWGPQLEILAHGSTGCFVTHCGWNSILEALSLGVPMVAMPQWTDQGTNAKFVEDVWGVGVRVSKDEDGTIARGEIERCIREVMEGERGKEIKRNAEEWRKLAKEAVDEGGSSDRNINDFVGKLVSLT